MLLIPTGLQADAEARKSRVGGQCDGARGGYVLTRQPSEIGLQEVIEVIQGPLSLSKCLLGRDSCCKGKACPIRNKLGELQTQMAKFLGGTTLADLVKAESD